MRSISDELNTYFWATGRDAGSHLQKDRSDVVGFDYYYGAEAEQFAFYRIPRILIKDERFKGVSSDAKLLYGLMLDRMSLSMRNGWIDEYNRVFIYYTVDEVMEDLSCTKGTVAKIFAELDCKKGIGLIEKKRQGQGKPDCIYVKNFVALETEAEVETGTKKSEEDLKKVEEETQKIFYKNAEGDSMSVSEVQNLDFKKSKICTTRSPENEPQEVQNLDFLKSKNWISRSSKNGFLEVQNLDPNKTDINKTNINNININKTEKSNNNPINQSIREKSKIDMIDKYKRLIAENIQYDYWLECGDIADKEQVKELYQLICDVVCVERETVRVNGIDYPYQLVKAQFLKINYSHIEYTLACLKSTTSRINNIRAYLVTTLYNAVSSMNCYYQQEVQHDLYGSG